MIEEAPFSYRVGRRVITLPRSRRAIGVRFREPALMGIRKLVADEAQLGAFGSRFEVPKEKFTVFLVPEGKAEIAPSSVAKARLAEFSDVERSAPVFEYGRKRLMATDRLFVKLTGRTDSTLRELQRMGFELLEESVDGLLLRLPANQDPLEAVALLGTISGIQVVEPDFVTVGENPRLLLKPGVSPSASALSGTIEQQAMRIISADLARQMQLGRPEIRIAILDDGIDAGHPDLSSAVERAYDAVEDGVLATVNGWDSHGTACAGLAAGRPVGPFGVMGVASGCSILAVRIALTASAGAPWVTSNSYIRRGIEWAMNQGADVMSNSWGGGAPSEIVASAFERARIRGRNGRGCVIVAAAGNEYGVVNFPANLSGVLTVSGTNELDEFKTPYSSDGEFWWGSNYGPEVDVAAPSVNLRTTDFSGTMGMDATDYFAHFNGTSGATPLVAGAAAVLLSADDTLMADDVARVLCESTDKVGNTEYVNGRNERFGFGRLNVQRALQMLRRPGDGNDGAEYVGDGLEETEPTDNGVPPTGVAMGYVEEESEGEEGEADEGKEWKYDEPPLGEVRLCRTKEPGSGSRENGAEEEVPAGEIRLGKSEL